MSATMHQTVVEFRPATGAMGPIGARAPSPMQRWEARTQGAACALCHLNTLCLPEGMAAPERADFVRLIARHRKLAAGAALFRAGDVFENFYFVKTGAIKTVMLMDDGREQITGFHLPGDMLGMDAINGSVHTSDAIALDDTRVCAIPFAQVSRMSRDCAPVQEYVHRKLAREVVREQQLMLLLGRMTAEERVAAFLRDLASRFAERGQSPNEFTLPMAREEIGNYLGLTLETVSRCFSRLKHAGVLDVDNRHIRIRDARRLVSGGGAGGVAHA